MQYCKSIACAKINAVLAIINAVLQKYSYIACAKINAILLQKCYNKGSIAKVLQELLHYINNKCSIAKE